MRLIGIFAECGSGPSSAEVLSSLRRGLMKHFKSKFAYNVIIELQPLSFRGSSNYFTAAAHRLRFLRRGLAQEDRPVQAGNADDMQRRGVSHHA